MCDIQKQGRGIRWILRFLCRSVVNCRLLPRFIWLDSGQQVLGLVWVSSGLCQVCAVRLSWTRNQMMDVVIIGWISFVYVMDTWWCFLPEASFGLRVLSLPPSVCLCVCVCGNHLLVRAITCHPFKLESPNLDQKSKTPWLRSLLFWGLIDLELQGQI